MIDTGALNAVNLALPVFRRIDDCYVTAQVLNQQLQAHRANTRQSVKCSEALPYIAALLLFCVCIRFGPARTSALFIVRSFCLIVSGLVSVGVFCFLRSYTQREKARNDQKENELLQRISDISKEIYDVTTVNQKIIDRIPRDYRFYDAVVYFEKALANGRAENLKEAMLQYDEEQHRLAMENANQMMLQYQLQQNAMLASIEKSSRSSAVNSGICAAFSVLSFLDSI